MKAHTIETVRKGKKSEVKSVPKTKREIVAEVKEKRIVTPVLKSECLTEVPVPEGHIRAIVLQSYAGMVDDIDIGDILDLTERRFKSLSLRGMVKEYKGTEPPTKRR